MVTTYVKLRFSIFAMKEGEVTLYPFHCPFQSLYLYTFLITLLILFGVSCGIVVRSIVLRRRFRRQIQNAIDSGMALPPRVAASRAGRRHQFGERPVMHEVWLNYKGTPLRQQKAGMNEDIETVDKPWQGMKVR